MIPAADLSAVLFPQTQLRTILAQLLFVESVV
jgi:hypothetical protein